MKPNGLALQTLPDTFAVCRMPSSATVPEWALQGAFLSISRSIDELSIVCVQSQVPAGVHCDRDWRCFKVKGTLAFGLTGILASLASPLAAAGVSLFAISTYDTDYVLVKQEAFAAAVSALTQAGHTFEP